MMNWKIKQTLIEDAFDSARSYYPKEFMCFLAGDKKNKIITEIVLLPTYNGENFASVDLNAMPLDDTIVGSLHSHPNGNAHPSSADKRFFARYEINIILGNHFNKQFNIFDSFGKTTNFELF